jgi:hypothetical protein
VFHCQAKIALCPQCVQVTGVPRRNSLIPKNGRRLEILGIGLVSKTLFGLILEKLFNYFLNLHKLEIWNGIRASPADICTTFRGVSCLDDCSLEDRIDFFTFDSFLSNMFETVHWVSHLSTGLDSADETS